WHAPVRIPHLGYQPSAVVDLGMAVDVQVARIDQADLNPMTSEQRSKAHRLALLTELVQLAAQRFDTRRLPTAHDRAEIIPQQVFDALNAWFLQQCQAEQLG